MSRAIKFRVWRDSFVWPDGKPCEGGWQEQSYISDSKAYYEDYEVLPSDYLEVYGGKIHIEQFTGLKDKNGREIYEGDIVRWTHPMTDVGVVEYVLDGAPNIQQCFWGVSVTRLLCVCAFQSDDEYEVIGDIHQNPDLLQPTKT